MSINPLLISAKELRLIDHGAKIPNKPKRAKNAKHKQTRSGKQRRNRYAGMPYREYLRTPHWKKFRQKILRIAGRQCFDCGATDQLEVHHLHYKTLGRETPRDCLVLCRKCHAARHSDKAIQVDDISREFQAMFQHP